MNNEVNPHSNTFTHITCASTPARCNNKNCKKLEVITQLILLLLAVKVMPPILIQSGQVENTCVYYKLI